MHPEPKSIIVQTIQELVPKKRHPKNTLKNSFESVQRNISNSETGLAYQPPKLIGCNDVLMGGSA